nr:GlsB/YeaQ/YmgE family stress response membrane protein [Planctomycetales bacterium]
RLATRSKEGYGRVVNTLLGMAGALVGGGVFQVFNINLGLARLEFSIEDLLAAFIGSVFLLVVIGGVRAKKKKLFWICTALAFALVVVALLQWSR